MTIRTQTLETEVCQTHRGQKSLVSNGDLLVPLFSQSPVDLGSFLTSCRNTKRHNSCCWKRLQVEKLSKNVVPINSALRLHCSDLFSCSKAAWINLDRRFLRLVEFSSQFIMAASSQQQVDYFNWTRGKTLWNRVLPSTLTYSTWIY